MRGTSRRSTVDVPTRVRASWALAVPPHLHHRRPPVASFAGPCRGPDAGLYYAPVVRFLPSAREGLGGCQPLTRSVVGRGLQATKGGRGAPDLFRSGAPRRRRSGHRARSGDQRVAAAPPPWGGTGGRGTPGGPGGPGGGAGGPPALSMIRWTLPPSVPAYSHRPSSVTARLVTLRLRRPWLSGSQLAPRSWLTRTPRPPLTTPISSKNWVEAANTRPLPPGANSRSLIHSGRSMWSARRRVTPPSSLVYRPRARTTSRPGAAGSTAMAVTRTSAICAKLLPPPVDRNSPSGPPAQIRSGSVGWPASASKNCPCIRLRHVAPPSRLSTNPASTSVQYPTSTRSGSAG